MKPKSLFVLLLIGISTHSAFCATGGIDIQKVLDAGGEVIIRSADGGARNVSVSKKKNNSSNDDPFKVDGYDETGTDSDNKLTPKQAELKKECEEIEEMNGTFDAKYNECNATFPGETLSMNQVKQIIDKASSVLSEDTDTTCNQAIYIPKKSWSIQCTDSDAFSGAFVLHFDTTEITCDDGFEFNDDNGSCIEKEKESSMADSEPETKSEYDESIFDINTPSGKSVAETKEDTKNDDNLTKKLHADAQKIIDTYKETQKTLNNKSQGA